jgi:hypothetical protein
MNLSEENIFQIAKNQEVGQILKNIFSILLKLNFGIYYLEIK